MPKWLALASVIGVIAGLGAVVFYEALSLSTHFFLGYLAGYKVPDARRRGQPGGVGPLRALVGGPPRGGSRRAGRRAIVFSFAPEAEGHGTDAAIDAVHHNPRGIRLRAVVVKIVASAVTIGSGGSGGREGPTAQISAGFGSLLARVWTCRPRTAGSPSRSGSVLA